MPPPLPEPLISTFRPFLPAAHFAVTFLSLPAVAADPALTTVAERSGFKQTGRYDEMLTLCGAYACAWPDAVRCFEFGTTPEGRPMQALVASRDGRTTVVDGPFAETKEVLGGFNLIEAADYDEALRIACESQWAGVGCIEVRPVRDVAAVRRRVGARPHCVRSCTLA